MERRDYLLQEIEKIGLLLRMILNKITSRAENGAISLENQFEEEKELVLNGMGFDLDKFLSLKASEIGEYLLNFNAIRGANIELLADVLTEMGMNDKSKSSNAYLEKALMLYEHCSSLDKTYSFDRESKINEIKNIIR